MIGWIICRVVTGQQRCRADHHGAASGDALRIRHVVSGLFPNGLIRQTTPSGANRLVIRSRISLWLRKGEAVERRSKKGVVVSLKLAAYAAGGKSAISLRQATLFDGERGRPELSINPKRPQGQARLARPAWCCVMPQGAGGERLAQWPLLGWGRRIASSQNSSGQLGTKLEQRR